MALAGAEPFSIQELLDLAGAVRSDSGDDEVRRSFPAANASLASVSMRRYGAFWRSKRLWEPWGSPRTERLGDSVEVQQFL